MYPGSEHQSLGVHQQVTLAALDLLATIITALLSTYASRLDRLGIHYASGRLRVSLQADPKAFAERSIDPLPSAVDTPFPEVPVNGGPSREVVRQQAPLAAASQDVEDGVQDLTKVVSPRPSQPFGCGHVGLDVGPFGVG